MKYEPTKQSLKNHKVPNWFNDAKLGIFIHWGLFSVPAFAITGIDLNESTKRGLKEHFKNNPYAEWYLNSLRIPGSPTQVFHKENYGEDFNYDDFAAIFNNELKKWSPEEMGELFRKSGARYVVLVTKHHDGFLLWPSKFPNPRKKEYRAARNIVGELTKIVRNKGMKIGYYYSGALDWSFQSKPIIDGKSYVENGPNETEYTEYANAHWYELIDDYDPVILWNDIGYPPNTNVYEIFAYFYNKNPDGVINDRWKQFHKSEMKVPKVRHWDFFTPEYETMPKITKNKWEANRGIGFSYGYNRMETEKEYLKSEDTIKMLVDIVSKNGNLLLNVGPLPDGNIPDFQKRVLIELGKWLEINGESIYATKPWIKAEGYSNGKNIIRFTQNQESLFIHLMEHPKGNEIRIDSMKIPNDSIVNILGDTQNIKCSTQNDDLILYLPDTLNKTPVLVFKVQPKPKID
jgi:alpha-L-fucosidase